MIDKTCFSYSNSMFLKPFISDLTKTKINFDLKQKNASKKLLLGQVEVSAMRSEGRV